jgi:flagellar basal-body rod protein FlgB
VALPFINQTPGKIYLVFDGAAISRRLPCSLVPCPLSARSDRAPRDGFHEYVDTDTQKSIMTVGDVSIFSMLRTRMQWHQERQRVLANNVANAETPNFVPHDLAEPQFDGRSLASVPLLRTDPGHQADPETVSAFGQTDSGFQIRPAGNGVTHENEMIKAADNQMNFQAATALYSKSLGLIKIAIGKK